MFRQIELDWDQVRETRGDILLSCDRQQLAKKKKPTPEDNPLGPRWRLESKVSYSRRSLTIPHHRYITWSRDMRHAASKLGMRSLQLFLTIKLGRYKDRYLLSALHWHLQLSPTAHCLYYALSRRPNIPLYLSITTIVCLYYAILCIPRCFSSCSVCLHSN